MLQRFHKHYDQVMNKKQPLIQTTHLRKVYGIGDGKTVALADVSLTVPNGQFVSIMGPSGSGKSTLLQILGFLDQQTSGEYLFEGTPAQAHTENELARVRNQRIGFIFQAFNLLPKTSVFENVQLPLVYSDVPARQWKDRIEQAIDAVGLSHRTHHQSGMLSGGEKQRCAIARALVMNPVLIFADEPTGNLDSASGQVVMQILQDLHSTQGHTIMLITHEQHTARYAERIVTIKDGKIASDEVVQEQIRAQDGLIK